MTGTPTERPSRSLVLAAFAAIYIIWGSTYLGIRIAILTIPPLLMAGIRFLTAGGLLLAWTLLRGERLPAGPSLWRIALSGLLLLFLGNGAVTWVEQYLPSGLAAIIVATVPLWFVLLDRRQWSFYFSNKGIILGLCVGFAGVLLLVAGRGSGGIFGDRTKVVSLLILVGGTICWTIGSLYAKYQSMEGSTLMKVAIQMVSAGLAFVLLGLLLREQDDLHLSHISGASLLALAYLILMGSLVGYLAYMWLLGVRPPSLVGTYAYVNPVVAVLLGWLFLQEHVSLQQGIGLAVVILGLVIVNLAKDRKREPAAVESDAAENWKQNP